MHRNSRIQVLDDQLVQSLLDRAASSPRMRVNYDFHSGADDNPQRFLNVMMRGTYVCPHRHAAPPKPESLLAIMGEAAFLTFDDSGAVIQSTVLGGRTIGIDAPPGVWHTLVVLTSAFVCYEVKPGPYSPIDDKEFARWAPKEGEVGVGEYLKNLMSIANDLRGSVCYDI